MDRERKGEGHAGYFHCVYWQMSACMHTHTSPCLMVVFISSKPQPSSSTFFFFCYGWKKRIIKLNCSSVSKGVYNISCREPQRLFWPPKNTQSADDEGGSKDRFPSRSTWLLTMEPDLDASFIYTQIPSVLFLKTLTTRQSFHTRLEFMYELHHLPRRQFHQMQQMEGA